MKKLATLFLTAGLVFAGVTGAYAIDFKVKGQAIITFEYGQGGEGNNDVYGYEGDDSFNALQRFRIQVDAVASESLSGTVFFEMGESVWGTQDEGAALGTDGTIVEVKRAYIDYVTPESTLKVRMGLQGMGLPSFTTGSSQVFVNDVAGLMLNNTFTDNVSVTAFWARPFNDNYRQENIYADYDNYLDNVDMFGLSMPMTFTGFKLNPWVMYTAVGANTFRGDPASRTSDLEQGLLPVTGVPADFGDASNSGWRLDSYGDVWHAGLTGQFRFDSPFTFAFDFNYGNASFGPEEYDRSGFYMSALAEYKMDWGTPGVYGWYSTGDDDDLDNGSERMPTISGSNGRNQFSSFGSNGSRYLDREDVIGEFLVGTWGLGVRVKDVSFLDDMKHTFAVNYYQGTNDVEMASHLDSFNAGYGLYLTENDYAVEFNFVTDYKIYKNLTLNFHASYIILGFDEDTWSHSQYEGTDAWNVSTSFVYSF